MQHTKANPSRRGTFGTALNIKALKSKTLRTKALATAALLAAAVAGFAGPARAEPAATQPAAAGPLQFTVKDIDGKDVNLADYKGKVVLIVNVASKCGLTVQYKALEATYRKYKDQGLVVLGFPANNFGGQEPGTEEQIKEFCTGKYDVTFPMFGKMSVKGEDKSPLYKYLTEKATAGQYAGEIGWNFTKFLINREGQIASRFESKLKPDDAKIIAAIEKELGTTP